MPFPKGKSGYEGRGAIQTGKRPPLETYTISFTARFHEDDNTGRAIKVWVEENFSSHKDFLVTIYKEKHHEI